MTRRLGSLANSRRYGLPASGAGMQLHASLSTRRPDPIQDEDD